MFKIINWNVNSAKARLDHLKLMISNENPDVILLQEIKSTNETFPIMEFEELGYNCAINGQKSYNGVAIISKHPIEDVIMKFSDSSNTLEHDASYGIERNEARYAECVISYNNKAVRVASIYVPNGSANGEEAKLGNLSLTETERFKYKMAFLSDLKNHMHGCLKYDEIAVFAGDYNVAPSDLDVYSVKNWTGQVCFLPEEKSKFREILETGYCDAMRDLHPSDQLFTWYDYRRGMFAYGKGIRIDHFLCSPQAIKVVQTTTVLNYYRGLEKPSDHVPIEIVLEI